MLRESTLTVVFIDSSALVVMLGSLAVLLARSYVAFIFSVVPASVLPFFVLSTEVGRVSFGASAEIAIFVPDGVGTAADAVLLVMSSAEVFQVFVVEAVLLFVATLDLVSFRSPAGIGDALVVARVLLVVRSNLVLNFSFAARVLLPLTSLSATVDQVSLKTPVKIVVVPDAVPDVDMCVLLVQYNEEVLHAFVAAASVLKFVAMSDLAWFEASATNELVYKWIRENAAARSNTISENIRRFPEQQQSGIF